MSTAEIKQAIEAMDQDERVRLTAWMVSRYPLLKVEHLMAAASKLVESGEWVPAPPTEDNCPRDTTLERAARVAEELDLGK